MSFTMLLHEMRASAHPLFGGDAVRVESAQQRAGALATRPGVIVASSGMLMGGASAFYAKKIAADPKNAILVTGYQDEESPGRALLDLAANDTLKGAVRIAGEMVEVACAVRSYGLSAHADRLQLVEFVESSSPRTVALVHGDPEARASLAAALSSRDVIIPKNGQTIVRSFSRRASPSQIPEPRRDLDRERARSLLGPDPGMPLSARRIAEAYFGRSVDRSTVVSFVAWLEEQGLARRDDEKPHLVWVQTPSSVDPGSPQARLEEELERDNPRGRLLERRVAERQPPPVFESRAVAGGCVARAFVDDGGQRIAGKWFRARTLKIAEQAAAESLLEALAASPDQRQPPEALPAVAQETTASASSTEPRMLLNELRQVGELASSGYRLVAQGGPSHQPLFTVAAWAGLPGGERVEGKPVEASSKKAAERAAASELVAPSSPTAGS